MSTFLYIRMLFCIKYMDNCKISWSRPTHCITLFDSIKSFNTEMYIVHLYQKSRTCSTYDVQCAWYTRRCWASNAIDWFNLALHLHRHWIYSTYCIIHLYIHKIDINPFDATEIGSAQLWITECAGRLIHYWIQSCQLLHQNCRACWR